MGWHQVPTPRRAALDLNPQHGLQAFKHCPFQPTHPAPPGSSPLPLQCEPRHPITFACPTPFCLIEVQNPAILGSQCNIPFSRKPSCPCARSVLNCLDTLRFSFGAQVPLPLSNVFTSSDNTSWALSSVRGRTGFVLFEAHPQNLSHSRLSVNTD